MESNTIKKSFTPTQRLWRMLKIDGKEIRNIYIYSIFIGLVSLSLPLGIQAIVNLIQGGQVSTAWIVLVVFVVLGVAITGVMQIFQLRIVENLQQKIFARASFEFIYRIPRVKMEELYKHYAPELMNRFFDVMSVQKGLPKLLITLISAILQVIFGLILLSLYHPFFIIFSLILVIVIITIYTLTARRGLETSLDESKHKYKVAHWLEEVARNIITLKVAGKSDLALQKADIHVSNYINAREAHFNVLVQQYIMMIVFKVVVVTGLLALGGMLVMQQAMNIGQFVAAEIIILLIINSVEKLIINVEIIYDVITSLEKIGQVTDLELESDKGFEMKRDGNLLGLDVELRNVFFGYPNSNTKVIQNMNFKIEPGEKLVITGPSNSGKSTFLRLLTTMYDVQEGVISYNGFPKNNIHPDSLRTLIGNCLYEESLFDGTLLENITLGRDCVTFDEVIKVVENIGLKSYIQSLPNGYETSIEPLGKSLPQSIVEKIVLARSIVSKPRLLLLEYPLENLNFNERNAAFDFITKSDNGWTMVAVTNDDCLAKRADRIAIMENGAIVKVGTYDEMKKIVDFKTY